MSTYHVLLIITAVLLLLSAVLIWRWRQNRQPAFGAPWPIPEAKQHAIVLVHGVLGFDHFEVYGKRQHYFRGIPQTLRQHGAVVHSVKVPPLGTVPERGEALVRFIKEIDERRIVIIGHSMGGLDARYAVSRGDIGKRVSALITVATPHRGSVLANAASTVPGRVLRSLLGKVGMETDALDWLDEASAKRFNEEIKNVSGVFYGSMVGKASRRQVMANLMLLTSFELLTRLRGDNDAMVPTASQHWGKVLQVVKTHHFGEIGWSPFFDAGAMYLELLENLDLSGIACLPEGQPILKEQSA